MVMTIHKLTVGDGYTYLTRHIAGGDVPRARGQSAADYYTTDGNPPGRWTGRGVGLLGLDGQRVTEAQMTALFGHGQHPNAPAMISAYQGAHLRAGMSDTQIREVQQDARKAATLGLGFPTYQPLAPFEERVGKRLDDVAEQTARAPTPAEVAKIQREESRRQRAAVAGFDVVFAPVKSAALLWALDDRAWVRDAVRAAHEDATTTALAMLEEHAAFTRTGTGGIAQIATNGLIAAAFDHYDSRDGDPNLHTHVAIVNKVQGVDGKWRSLDARALYRITVAASERYNTAFQASLTARLNVSWVARKTRGSREPVFEIDGVPEPVVRHFSRRRAAIEARYAQLLAAYRAAHHHDPPIGVSQQLARQATLDTRRRKKPPRSLAAMRAEWRASVTAVFGRRALARLAAAVPAPTAAPRPRDAAHPTTAKQNAPLDPEQLAAALADQVVAAVGEARSTWTRWNLHAEAERLIRARKLATHPDVHTRLVDAVVEQALAPDRSITVETPALVDEPDVLRRADGESIFVEHGAARYTSTTVLDAEQRLVKAAHTTTATAVPDALVRVALADFDTHHGRPLDDGQRRLVTAFATDPRLLAVGLGAAGTGKTTAMRAYRHTLRATGQRLVPLATSAAAAAVLASELDVPAENVHKFLYEYRFGLCADQLQAGAPVPAAYQQFALRPGDVVLVDEAGMAGTPNLDRLVTLAQQRGATVRLLGDYRQLGAVESGGALRLLATEAGAVELSTLHRFTDPDEADATLGLREGRTGALDFYEDRGRIRGGSQQAMLDAVYRGWLADVRAGAVSLMSAATNSDVAALAARARTDRIALGQVEHQGVLLHDGNRAGRGDWIVTRRNHRRLTCRGGRDFVRNGDPWHVLRRHRDGSLTVRHLSHGGRVRLPAEYVAEHVELLYATTVHRAQGTTVDTAHALITADMVREALYVALTRARNGTRLYVPTHELLPLDEDDRLDRTRYDPRVRAAREVLDTVLSRESGELSATQTIRDNQERAASLTTLVPPLIYVSQGLAEQHYRRIAADLLGDQHSDVTDDPAWSALVDALHEARTDGWQPEQLLAQAIASRSLTDAESLAQVLAWRCRKITAEESPGPWLTRPTPEQAARYADLAQAATGHRPDPAHAAEPPPALRAPAAETRTPRYAQAPAGQVRTDAVQVAAALGVEPAVVEAHHAWPQLAGILAATRAAGHPTAPLLDQATRSVSGDVDLGQLTATAGRLAEQRHIAVAHVRVPRPLAPSDIANRVLGHAAADRARTEAAWPALRAALFRTEAAGHNPEQLLRDAAADRGQLPARHLSQWLAHRVRARAAVPAADGRYGAWQTLAWILAAHEHAGGNPADLLPTGATHRPTDVLRHASRAALTAHQARTAATQILPWIPPAPAADTDGDPALISYDQEVRSQIRARVAHLTTVAGLDRPAWTTALGTPPAAAADRKRWQHALGIVAAYRDQHQITDDDPAHPLGPYIEEGRPGHHAYWHAADAIATAHRLTGTRLSLRPRHTTDPHHLNAAHRIAADTYRALPDAERTAIATAVIARLDTVWQGTTTDLDTGITQPAYARHLHDALTHAGHLSAPDTTTTRTNRRPPRARSAPPAEPPTTSRRASRSATDPRQQPTPAPERRTPAPLLEPRPSPQRSPNSRPAPRL